MGRPKRTEATAKTGFVLPVDLLAEIAQFCQAQSIGRSRFAERALRELLERERAGRSSSPWNWGHDQST